ncbi:DinB family protein [Catellatospora sp. TT07R-123]|uniref:DinB family protein n=1 Tax=Catellatospora sp. TT07R-123 TaxID=2733863 RepID=UPI001FD61EEC|nr:DinB family protein [Catellatospora sp. TT07R-123]
MTQVEAGYPEPPAVGGEAETLLGSLERQRATFAWKCAGLGEHALRMRVGVSRVTLGGLLKHLAYLEDLNFTCGLAGGDLPKPWRDVDWAAEPGWDWRSAGRDQPAELYGVWEQAVERSRLAVSQVLLSFGVDAVYTAPGGSRLTLRRLLVDMIEEYARHTGHADLLREAVDGRVGEDPPGPAYPFQIG